MRKLVVGILAHVDAGKTTLAESILYLTGSIRKLGRVDHKDTFLDTNTLERARGITIFSKQAILSYKNIEITLLDTPGHVDFSAEMERTLQVLDYAILVISASDGIQGHTETLWRLLIRYGIPTFLFINKTDLEGTNKRALMEELKRKLGDGCIDFSGESDPKDFMENLALCDEDLLEQYMEYHILQDTAITKAIAERKVYPCYFGSALKLNGVEAMLDGLEQYTQVPTYPDCFGARIYKISRDEQGNRLTHMKITGGSLRVKQLLTNQESEDRRKSRGSITPEGEQVLENWEEKVNQIRIYSGVRYEAVEEAMAGTVCAVTGLSRTYPGEGLGREAMADMPILEPVLTYQMILPQGCDPHNMLTKLLLLEEDPQLHIVWSEQLKELQVQLMGEVQIEILKSIIAERFKVEVEFGAGNIVYKETIRGSSMGVGHFEPLRHYAEVLLLLEADEPGSGLSFITNCSEDILERSWQRLILTHLEEKEHLGVLTGSPITDMKITLVAGRAHQKHTEGGDFRQATYRAVRQGLKLAQSVLLEPYYDFKLEIPSEAVGRAMSDIVRMSGSFSPPEVTEELALITGFAPVATMMGYQSEVTAYTKGRGRLFCSLRGYLPCHNFEEVIQKINYDSERDLNNPTGSVFCSHGAGFVVDWDQVPNYMHLDAFWQQKSVKEVLEDFEESPKTPKSREAYGGSLQEDKELEAIFTSTYGPIKSRRSASMSGLGYENKNKNDKGIIKRQVEIRSREPVKEYLLVDGYNIIFSWEELNELAKVNMDAARSKLMDILCNYQGFKKCILILVFDAYKVKGGLGEVFDYHNIHIVYTREAETADEYIEKVTHEIAGHHHVTVATSDALEQLIILGQGAVRFSAKDLKEEITRVRDQIRRDYLDKQPGGRAFIGDQFDDILGRFEEESSLEQK